MQNYHKHCSESNIFTPDSAATYEDYAKRAMELGHRVISTVEHGWQGRYHHAYDIVKQFAKPKTEKGGQDYQLKLIFGAEAYWVKDNQSKDRTNGHIIMLAKNENGRRKINGILSDANEFGYYYKPRVDEQSILSLPPDDVFITTACVAFWQYEDDYMEDFVKRLANHFGDNFKLEVQYHNTDKQKELNQRILQLSEKYGIGLIAGMDSHYIHPEQAQEREFILESKKISYDDEDGWYMDYPDDETVYRRFVEQGILNDSQIREAMDTTDLLLDFEDFTVDNPVFSTNPKLPTLYDGEHVINGRRLPKLNQEQRNKVYSQLITKLFKEYLKGVPEERHAEYFEGVNQEVQVIKETNMSDYFLIDYEIVKRAIEKGGVLTNSGRGSAVGYMTNTLLGFSKVDRFRSPIKLYPERFISKSRILESNSLPDIDLNWGTPEIAEEAQEEILGKNHAYPMIAFGTYKKKSAFKLYARARDLDFDIANNISKQIEKYEEAEKHAEDEEERKAINIYEFVDEEYHDYITQSQSYWGIISDKKKAPCSYLLYAGDIREEIGLIKCKSESTKKEYITTVIDGAVAENYKFLKNDILKVDTVLLTDLVYKRIGMKPHTVNELTEAVASDQKVWDVYARGLTIGVNQCEKDSTIQKVKHYQPQNVSELSAFIAGIRPGFKSMYSTFASRQTYEYGIKSFDDLIQTEQFPYSFIMYQEQLMTTLNYAGFPIDKCYQIIKDISKKHPEKVLPLREDFLKGFSSKILVDCSSETEAMEMSEKVWKIIYDSTSYSFNSSHAYCMALDSLYNAWQKANHPYEFYEVLLQVFSDKGKKDKVADLKREMKDGFGINEGDYRWGLDNRKFVADKENSAINPSLVSIKGLSQGFANDLYSLSQKKSYDNFYDLWKDVNSLKSSNSAKIGVLVCLNYFKEFGSITKITRFLNIVSELYERTQFKKGDEVTLKYERFIKQFSESETEKLYRGFDYDAALKEIWTKLKDVETPCKDILGYELELLGYVKTVVPEVEEDYVMITRIEGKYANKNVTLYRICDGTSEKVKVKGKKLELQPLREGDIIKTIEFKEDKKWRKGEDGKFFQIDEKETILTRWRVTI